MTKTERFNAGPFHFTFRGDRVWFKYRQRDFGQLITVSGATSISITTRLRAFFDPASDYGHDGLVIFARYYMGDVPGVVHWAEHYTRVRGMIGHIAKAS